MYVWITIIQPPGQMKMRLMHHQEHRFDSSDMQHSPDVKHTAAH